MLLFEMERVGFAVLWKCPRISRDPAALCCRSLETAGFRKSLPISTCSMADPDLVADVEADRGEFELDGDGVGFSYAGSVRVIVFAARHCNGDDHATAAMMAINAISTSSGLAISRRSTISHARSTWRRCLPWTAAAVRSPVWLRRLRRAHR